MTRRTYSLPDTAHARALEGRILASFPRRAIALLLDFLIAGVSFLLIVLTVGPTIAGLSWVQASGDVNLKFTFFGNWYSIVWLVLYFTLSVYWSDGRTPGKALCRIRILSLVHGKMSFWHALERALGYGASALEAGFGFFQYFLREDRRTVHDRIAETIVVDARTNRAGAASQEPQTK